MKIIFRKKAKPDKNSDFETEKKNIKYFKKQLQVCFDNTVLRLTFDLFAITNM